MPELIPAEPGTPGWHAARRQGVTATDIVSILGIGYKSAYWVYWNKLGQVPDEPDSDRYRLGRELEPYVCGRWGEANPDASYDLLGPRLYRSVTRPWQMATPDSVLYDSTGVTGTGREVEPAATVGVLECKTWADADRHSWADGPPPAVRAQVLWQMDVMDVSTGHVGVVFLPSGEFRGYVIEDTGENAHDQQLMRDRGWEFMRHLRGELPPPDIDASAASLAAVKARFGDARKDKTVTVDVRLWQQWTDFKNAAALNEANARSYENQIREQVGEAGAIEVDGQLVARRLVYDAQVKAHTRHVDSICRVKQQEDDDGA